MNEIKSLYTSCGYQSYVDQYLTFPPSGVQPAIEQNATSASCDIYDMAITAEYMLNPCFDTFEIVSNTPLINAAIRPSD